MMRVLCINFFVKMITHADVSVLVGQGGGGGFSPLWWRWWRGRERRRVTTVTVGLAPLGNPYNFNLFVIHLASHLSWHAGLFVSSDRSSLHDGVSPGIRQASHIFLLHPSSTCAFYVYTSYFYKPSTISICIFLLRVTSVGLSVRVIHCWPASK